MVSFLVVVLMSVEVCDKLFRRCADVCVRCDGYDKLSRRYADVYVRCEGCDKLSSCCVDVC